MPTADELILLDRIKKLQMVPMGTQVSPPAIQAPEMPAGDVNSKLDQVKRLRGMTPPAQPDVVSPGAIADSPYLQASRLEEQNQPQPGPTSIMGKLGRAAMEGLASSGMPGGYAQFQQQQYQREQDRQQNLYQRVKDLKNQGFQQSQVYRQDQNEQLASDRDQRDFNANQAYRDEQLKLAKVREMREAEQANKPENFTLGEGQKRYDANGKLIASGAERPAPQGPKSDYEWVNRGGKPVQIVKGSAQPGDTPYDAVSARKDDAGGPSPYSTERAFRTKQSVKELMGKVNNWTVGPGSMLSGVPGSDALNFKAQLQTLKSSIMQNELAQMRASSKTGGALGAVSDRESTALENSLGALDQAQSVDEFKGQLQKVYDSIERWETAQAMQGAPGGNVTVTEKPIIQRNKKTGATRYSLDGGKTWQDGKPQ